MWKSSSWRCYRSLECDHKIIDYLLRKKIFWTKSASWQLCCRNFRISVFNLNTSETKYLLNVTVRTFCSLAVSYCVWIEDFFSCLVSIDENLHSLFWFGAGSSMYSIFLNFSAAQIYGLLGTVGLSLHSGRLHHLSVDVAYVTSPLFHLGSATAGCRIAEWVL